MPYPHIHWAAQTLAGEEDLVLRQPPHWEPSASADQLQQRWSGWLLGEAAVTESALEAQPVPAQAQR